MVGGLGTALGTMPLGISFECSLHSMLLDGSVRCQQATTILDPPCLQAQVQQVAAATLKLLTGEDVAVPAAPAAAKKTSTAAAAAAAKGPVVDLLSMDDEPSSSAPAAAAAPASGINLLGELAGPAPEVAPSAAPAAPAAPAAAVDMFSGLGVHADAPASDPAAAASSNGDMFGGLSVEAPPAAAAVAAPAAAAAAAGTGSSKQSAPLDDLFAGLTTSPKPASSFNLLGSPQPLQQQQQQGALPGLGALGAAPQQQQQQDWLGGDLGVPGPKLQQPGLGAFQVCVLL